MMIALYKNPPTSLAMRQVIATSNEPALVLAVLYGMTEQTIKK